MSSSTPRRGGRVVRRELVDNSVPPARQSIIHIVPTGSATSPGGCGHVWIVVCEQKWRWHVRVECRDCRERHHVPGAWWSKRDADEIVSRVLAKLKYLGPG